LPRQVWYRCLNR